MNLIRTYFGKNDLDAIAAAIRDAEKETAGEVRVEIRQRRHKREQAMSVEQIARAEFVRLGMTNTRDRTGVLVFLLLEDRQFCVLADEGIHAAVGQEPWTEIARGMAARFKDGAFTDGLVGAVRGIGKLLKTHLPPRPDDTNELPDSVTVR